MHSLIQPRKPDMQAFLRRLYTAPSECASVQTHLPEEIKRSISRWKARLHFGGRLLFECEPLHVRAEEYFYAGEVLEDYVIVYRLTVIVLWR